jgi:hypothetical protein
MDEQWLLASKVKRSKENRVGYTRIDACGQEGADSLGGSRKQTL